MFRYIIDRVIALFITLFIIVSIAFCVVRLMPGSVYDQDGDLSQTVIDTLNEKYHNQAVRLFPEECIPPWRLGHIHENASQCTSI